MREKTGDPAARKNRWLSLVIWFVMCYSNDPGRACGGFSVSARKRRRSRSV